MTDTFEVEALGHLQALTANPATDLFEMVDGWGNPYAYFSSIDYDRTVAPMISAALQLTDNWGIGGSYLSADWDWEQQPYRGASETVHYMGIQLAGNPLELNLRSETEYPDWQINLRRTFRVRVNSPSSASNSLCRIRKRLICELFRLLSSARSALTFSTHS